MRKMGRRKEIRMKGEMDMCVREKQGRREKE
jgi:hypothetical protein